nr:cytochrome c oxidase assembly protein [Agrobacterium vitis]
MLAVVWLGPLLDSWRDSFSAHMVAHMSVVGVAAPLIAIGLSKCCKAHIPMPLTLPVVASVLELITVWSWHAPIIRRVVETSVTVTVVEQAMFLLVGILLWWTCLAQPSDKMHAAIGAGALLLTSIHMTLLGALLSLSQRPLYGDGEVTCFGVVLGAQEDQQLGGIIMLLVGAIVYLAGGLLLARRLVADPVASDGARDNAAEKPYPLGN